MEIWVTDSEHLRKSRRTGPRSERERLNLVACVPIRARSLAVEGKVRQPWSPAKYRKEARKAYVRELLINRALEQALPPQEQDLPAILSLEHLAKMSGTNPRILDEIVKRHSSPYRTFAIRKRNGGKRWINTPLGDLRVVQSWIHHHVLLYAKKSPYSYSYWPGKSILTAAEIHTECCWLVKIDIEQFFESISEIQVYRVLRQMYYPALVCLQIARLCTRVFPVGSQSALSRYGEALYNKNHWRARERQGTKIYTQYADPLDRIGALPQGAPTSPLLAELATRSLDKALSALASRFDLSYTIYADDLTFSTASQDFNRATAVKFIHGAYGLLLQHGLSPNRSKTMVVPPGTRKVVLGLLVDTDRPRLTKEYRDRVRLHIYHANRVGPQSHSEVRGFDSVIGFRNHLHGLISYARSIDPGWADARLVEFDKIDWPL